MNMFKRALGNRITQLLLALLIGGALGVVFYPTKTIEETAINKTRVEEMKKQQVLEKKHQEEVISLHEKFEEKEKSLIKTITQSSTKISTLTKEVTSLKSKTQERTYRLVKPDGTIVEKTYKESDTEAMNTVVTDVKKEFDQKISQVEKRWKTTHVDRIKDIQVKFNSSLATLQETYRKEMNEMKTATLTKVNEKRFGVEIGALLNLDWYVHSTGTIYGPIFVGGGVILNNLDLSSANLGLGVQF